MTTEIQKLMNAINRDRAKQDKREDMARRKVTSANPETLQTAIAEVVTALRATATATTSSSTWSDLTTEGKVNEWKRRSATHAARLDRIQQAMDDLNTVADKRLETAWGNLHPVAQGEQATQTAEMYVARVLGRGTMDVADLEKITQAEPSPGRTLLLEEIVARGWWEQDTVDKFVAAGNPDYLQLVREVNQIKTDVNSALGTQMRFARQRLESVHTATSPEQDYEGMVKVHTEGVGEDAPELELWGK